jgi:hypothetical protein
MKRLIYACLASVLAIGLAHAQNAVETGGGTGYLLAPPHPRASAVLMPGGPGTWNPIDFVVRNQRRLAAAGIATLGIPRSTDAAAAIRYMERVARPVTLVAISRGTLAAAQALAAGARPDRVVFISGFMAPAGEPSVPGILGSPARLPSTLVLTNTADECPMTSTAGARAFKQWAGRRVRLTVVTLPSPRDGARPCGAFASHAYFGHDAEAIARIVPFIRRH